LYAALKEAARSYRERAFSVSSRFICPESPFALDNAAARYDRRKNFQKASLSPASLPDLRNPLPQPPSPKNPDDVSTKKKNIARMRQLRIEGNEGSEDYFCTASPAQPLFSLRRRGDSGSQEALLPSVGICA
jgi:hypothetical protein